MTEYTRPELTPEEISSAEQRVKSIFRRYGLNGFADLILENMRLLKECNEHRIAREIEPLKVHDV